jgi:hypothetical protein
VHGPTAEPLNSELSAQGQCPGRRACFTSRAIAQASATGPTCSSFSGLATERIVWIRPPSTSNVNVPTTLPSRSRTIAPGWPFNAHGSTLASILMSNGKTDCATRIADNVFHPAERLNHAAHLLPYLLRRQRVLLAHPSTIGNFGPGCHALRDYVRNAGRLGGGQQVVGSLGA